MTVAKPIYLRNYLTISKANTSHGQPIYKIWSL